MGLFIYVEHPDRLSIITLQGRALAQKGVYRWIEHDEAVLERSSKVNEYFLGIPLVGTLTVDQIRDFSA